MSLTEDLDETIKTLQEWLSSAKTEKSKLAIADRLLKAMALKYKHAGEGKGGKFNLGSNGGDHAGSRN